MNDDHTQLATYLSTIVANPVEAQPLTDVVLNDRYQVMHELGQGGMGSVHLALDTYLEREVAVKVLNKHTLGTSGQALLLNEARAAARLSHPNVVMVFDVGEQNGIPFIVMEYVPGQTLSNARPKRMGDVMRIARQLCAALHHAHQKGLVHRDVKPHNVIITAEGVAKLMDFGLARALDRPLDESDKSFTGTVSYVAPEQALGEPVDYAADLYALGVVLYEMSTGSLPFSGRNMQIVIKHIQEMPTPPRDINPAIAPAVNELIMHLLQKDPRQRPESAEAVGQLLEVLINLTRIDPMF